MSSTQNRIYIPKPDIFSFAECLHFLDRGYDDCLYSIESDHLLKPLCIEGQNILLKVTEEPAFLIVQPLFPNEVSEQTLKQATAFVQKWFDLKRNLNPFYHLLDERGSLSFMQNQYYGLRLMGIPDLFEALCWCVIGQQINLTFAYRLKRRLVERYGTSITYDSSKYSFFPEPDVLANLTIEELREKQFSRRKAEYIIGIAQQFAEGKLSKSFLVNLPNKQQRLKRLLKIRGVGEWTANYVLMKSLKQMNCITYGDTGLQNAVSSLLNLKRKPTHKEIEDFFEPFTGWESYLNIYLWRTLS
jgi:DNA-3-methyladenine glycosylase II